MDAGPPNPTLRPCRWPSGRDPPPRGTADDPGAAAVLAPIRVLIADDQRVVRAGLRMLIGLPEGVDVVDCTADGTEAVAVARDLSPDVMLMDLGTPAMDGVVAARVIRDPGMAQSSSSRPTPTTTRFSRPSRPEPTAT